MEYDLGYDAESRLVTVTGAATASFTYDGDGKQVKSIVGGVTTYYVGRHYEKKGTTVTKYYFAGATRLAARSGTNGTLSYLLGDHLGSSSVTANASGVRTASALYKAWGETRYSSGALGTDYKFTGQREQAELGLYFYGARWFDPSIGRFTSPDTMIPSTQGTQAWDRYAYTSNNPLRYIDPSGHGTECGIGQTCPEDQPTTDDELEDIVQEEDNPIEAYCGENSTLSCISMVLQDATTLLDLVGVGLIEAPLVALGCLEGGLVGCAAGEVVAAGVWNLTLNNVDVVLSWLSTGFTIADDLVNNGGIGENTITSVATSIAGMMAPTPSIDLIIDAYAVGYNHGVFNGLISIGNGAPLFNW